MKGPEAAQTDPQEAKEFVERTGVDCLAVSIGTQHGHYVAAPHLNIERLKAIKEVVDVPLVLHGGSGTPLDQVQEAIRCGIRSDKESHRHTMRIHGQMYLGVEPPFVRLIA